MLQAAIVWADLTCIPNNDVLKEVPAKAGRHIRTTAAYDFYDRFLMPSLTHSSSWDRQEGRYSSGHGGGCYRLSSFRSTGPDFSLGVYKQEIGGTEVCGQSGPLQGQAVRQHRTHTFSWTMSHTQIPSALLIPPSLL